MLAETCTFCHFLIKHQLDIHFCFDVLLTVHLSIMLVINQLNEQILVL